jgi:hypothetical protein
MPQASTVEPAAPWSIRPAITPVSLLDRAMSTQEAVNSTRPPTKMRRRPKTSPIAPAVTMTAAPTSMYPVTAHCSRLTVVFRSALIAGSRIVTADVFALTTRAETQAASRTPRPAARLSRVVVPGPAINFHPFVA